MRNIRKLFEHEKEYDYKPFKADNLWSNNYIEYELLTEIKHYQLKIYLRTIRPYLKYTRNDLKKSDTCKIQSTITITFVSHKETDEERL